jgi:iron complex transport system ATP-binding protein
VVVVEESGMSVPLLRANSLRVDAGARTLCADLDFEVSAGQFWCLLGKNGAGKSTLLHTLAGLHAPTKGSVSLEGDDIRRLRPETLAQRRGLLAQQQFDAFSSSVLDTVMAGRYPYQLGLGWENAQDKTVAAHALATVGLADCAAKDVMKLSGGERQRVALATLLAQDPDIFLLDEPTSHQDAASQLAVMTLMKDIVHRDINADAPPKAVIAACHDINLVSRFATHVLVLADGRHWAGQLEHVMTPAILQEAFGCEFDIIDAPQGRFFIPRSWSIAASS